LALPCLLLSVLFAITSPLTIYALGTDAALKTSLDRDTVYIGDAIVCTVGVIFPRQSTLEPPPPSDQLGSFEVRDYQVLPQRARRHDGQKTEINWTLVPFATGDLEIPPIAMVVIDSSGRPDTLRTQAQRVTVASLNPDPQGGIRDIKPPATLPGGRAWMWWLAAVAAVAAGGLLLFRFLRRRRLRQALGDIAYQGPPRPAHEIALEELERIAALKLLEKGLIKEFYSQIAEIIKRYIGGRYHLETMELTTTELLQAMGRGSLPGDHIDLFRPFFGECDLVKFAKYMPPTERTARTLDGARDLVLATKEQPPAPEPADKATTSSLQSTDASIA